MYKALIMAASFAFAGAAQANEIFENNCSACHKDGGNIINAKKALTKEALEENGMYSVAAVKKIVSEGKSPMPGFSATLEEKQIDEVAAYVIEKAGTGW